MALNPMTLSSNKKGKKFKILLLIAIFLFITLIILTYTGKPLLGLVSDANKFRQWISSKGVGGYFTFIALIAFQVVIALLPGEPLEIVAGYAFGPWIGTLLCMVGAALGSLLVFLFVRHFGVKAAEVFFHKKEIKKLSFLEDHKKLNLLVFILFLIPGTPKDIMTYFIGLTKMKLHTWMLISTIARIPSIVTSTISGDALGLQNYQFAFIVFAITLVMSSIGLLFYKQMCTMRHNGR